MAEPAPARRAPSPKCQLPTVLLESVSPDRHLGCILQLDFTMFYSRHASQIIFCGNELTCLVVFPFTLEHSLNHCFSSGALYATRRLWGMMYFHIPLAGLCIHSVGCGNVPERVSGVERD